MITYNNYPSLLFLSYNKDNAPEELPFQVASESVLRFLFGSEGYNEMFAIFTSLNSLSMKPRHFWLNNKNFKDVEYNLNFRNSHFSEFLSSEQKEVQYGVICFKDGGQYVYLYLPPGKAKMKGIESDGYLATALFKGNVFIGFEEAIVGRGLSVMPTGYYEGGMDIGGYLSFTIVCLSFFASGCTRAGSNINNTKEDIWTK